MALTVTFPLQYHIYQRDENNLGRITIRGTYSGTPGVIQARWRTAIWTDIVPLASGGTWQGTLENQGAGQDFLQVRILTDSVQVDDISVGDIFLVAGQSNAAGHGDNNQSWGAPFGRKAVMFKRGTSAWAELADPAGAEGGSPWPALATYLMATAGEGVPVGFITTGVDGTSLVVDGDWEQGGPQYTNCLAQVTASGVTTVKAILWHQGEAEINAGVDQEVYESALSQMLDDMQADNAALAGVKLVAAQIGYKSTAGSTRAEIDPIRLAIADRWNSDPDILAGPVLYDIDLSDGDGVHFGSGSDSELTTLGGRWWRMLSYHFYGSSVGRSPRLVSATRNGLDVTVTFSGSALPLLGQNDTTGWRATNYGVVIAVNSATASGGSKVVLRLASEPVGELALSFGSGNDGAGTLLRDSGGSPPETFVDTPVTNLPDAGDTSSLIYDLTFGLSIDIEESDGTKLGSGPIVSASQWRFTARMDKAGNFSFTMPANDPKAQVVAKKRIARATALLNGRRVEVGAGIIDHIEREPQSDGTVQLVVSGDDLLRELSYRSVLRLKLQSGGSAISQAAALALTESYAPSGWNFIADEAPGNNLVYGSFNGETVLAALIKIAEKSESHFVRAADRLLVFASTFSDSGMRALGNIDQPTANSCIITRLTESINSYDLFTRIYPRGSGNADAQLTLRSATLALPDGYVMDTQDNYIESVEATLQYGRIERQVDYREIGPVSNTDADILSASNMLARAALELLRTRSVEVERAAYALQLEGCSRLLKPMQTLRVVYRNQAAGLVIDADLNILEATWQVAESGIHTTGLVVSYAARWPKSDTGALVENIAEGKIYQGLPQLNLNEYCLSFSKSIDADESAEFRFRFSQRVVQLTEVLFEFQILPLESTVKSVGGETTSSEPSSEDSSTGGSTHSHTVTLSNHTHPVPNHDHNLSIVNVAAGWPALHLYSSGFTAIGALGASGTVPTNPSTGATTASGGGATATTSGNESAHTHGIEHDHTFTPVIVMEYGVFRDDLANTFAIGDLEYSLDGSTWFAFVAGVNGYDLVEGWHRVDLTALLSNPVTFRPLQDSNELQIRRQSGGASKKGDD